MVRALRQLAAAQRPSPRREREAALAGGSPAAPRIIDFGVPCDYEWNSGLNLAMLAFVPNGPIGLSVSGSIERLLICSPLTARTSRSTTILASVRGR